MSSNAVRKFFFTSTVMWALPLAILYGFNHHIFPGTGSLSSSSHTLLSGFLAVFSVNLVIGFYIFMAMREPPSSTHQPDPTFLAQAQASIQRTASGGNAVSVDSKKAD